MTRTARISVYTAGPDVFRTDAVAFFAEAKAYGARLGLRVISPFDNEVQIGTPDERATDIFEGNVEQALEADAVVASLAPFRGPSADVGTAFELGLATANGAMIVGYGLSPQPYKERVTPDGMAAEGFGLSDNLMLVKCLAFQAPDWQAALKLVAEKYATHC